MSNEGGRLKGQPQLAVYPTFLRRAPADREGYAEHVSRMYALIGSPGFPRDDEETRERARIAYDRGVSPAGSGRQHAALLASPNRTRGLRGIRAPTLVVHGTRDRLVNRSGGRAVARTVPDARLLEIDGMGHDVPAGAWPRIADTVARARTEVPTPAPR